jgi:hypothetical protein
MNQPRIAWLHDHAGTDLAAVGGKNAFFAVKTNVADAEKDHYLTEVTTHADSATVA